MNTKDRHEEIYSAAAAEVARRGGVETIDSSPNKPALLREMYRAVATATDCHLDTAKRNVAKALRRGRFAEMQAVGWGGSREGAGRPPKE